MPRVLAGEPDRGGVVNPPVYLEGEGALLPDGTFVPEANIKAAVEAINRLCEWVRSLPPDVRVQLEAMAVVREAEAP